MNLISQTTFVTIAFSLAAVSLSAFDARADEVCVVCTEPAASYRCTLAGDGPAPASGPGQQLLCIKELATRGGHKSCTIDRTRANGPCNGVLVAVTPTGSDGLAAPAAVAVPAPAVTGVPRPAAAALPQQSVPEVAAAPPPAVSAPPVKEGPPPTLEALAKATAEQSKKDWESTNAKVKESTEAAGNTIKKAGNAVGSAVKKSWDCVVSLFSSC